MEEDVSKPGPRDDETTGAPPKWQKTTVYLPRDRVRWLKQTALDSGRTMSKVLRQAIDRYLARNAVDPRLSESQRQAVAQILREQLDLEEPKLAKILRELGGADSPERRG